MDDDDPGTIFTEIMNYVSDKYGDIPFVDQQTMCLLSVQGWNEKLYISIGELLDILKVYSEVTFIIGPGDRT